MRRLPAVVLLFLITVPAFAATPDLSPEQKSELDRVTALRLPQEHIFAETLAYHAETVLECSLPNSEETVSMTAGDLALKAIGHRGPIEWLRDKNAEEVLVDRIHSQNDGIIANLTDQLLRALTFGLMDDHTIYTLRSGDYLVSADFRYGTEELRSVHCSAIK